MTLSVVWLRHFQNNGGYLIQARTLELVSAVLLSLMLVVTGACVTRAKTTAPTRVTVTDIAGRQVSVTVPVARVVLPSARDLHMLAAVAGGDAIKKIAGWGPDLRLNDHDTYLKYKEKFPEIETIPEVGYHLKGTFSMEKVISLKPDLVIFPLWLADSEGVAEDMAKLDEVGIPSIVIDYWKKPLENSAPSTLLLGTLLGEEKRAQEIVKFSEEQVNKVTSRLEKIDKPKPRVYVEVGLKGASEYGDTYGATGWGIYIVGAGGINIAEAIVKTTAPINPEYLLKENPDVIVITGSYWAETSGSMRLGYQADPLESRELLKAFTRRPGWNILSAVKHGRVHSIYHPFVSRIHNFVAIPAFAKWFYPDEFRDLDPEKIFKEFHEKFLPVDYSGVWMLGLKD